jgi:hypothetical protein
MLKRTVAPVFIAGLSLLALSGCAAMPYINPNDPGQRALGGAAIGAGSGAAIGGAIGGWDGAAVGAAVGGVVGAVTGAATTPTTPAPTGGYPPPPG